MAATASSINIKVRDDDKSHWYDIANTLGQLSSSDGHTDVNFHCKNGTILKGNVVVLGHSSTVFKSILKQCCHGDISRPYDLLCPDFCPEAMKKVLDLIYSGETAISVSNKKLYYEMRSILESFGIEILMKPLEMIFTEQPSVPLLLPFPASNDSDSDVDWNGNFVPDQDSKEVETLTYTCSSCREYFGGREEILKHLEQPNSRCAEIHLDQSQGPKIISFRQQLQHIISLTGPEEKDLQSNTSGTVSKLLSRLQKLASHALSQEIPVLNLKEEIIDTNDVPDVKPSSNQLSKNIQEPDFDSITDDPIENKPLIIDLSFPEDEPARSSKDFLTNKSIEKKALIIDLSVPEEEPARPSKDFLTNNSIEKRALSIDLSVPDEEPATSSKDFLTNNSIEKRALAIDLSVPDEEPATSSKDFLTNNSREADKICHTSEDPLDRRPLKRKHISLSEQEVTGGSGSSASKKSEELEEKSPVTKDKIHYCHLCAFKSTDIFIFQRHLVCTHFSDTALAWNNGQKLQCKICSVTFINQQILMGHLANCHSALTKMSFLHLDSSDKFSCNLCTRKTYRRRDFEMHLALDHFLKPVIGWNRKSSQVCSKCHEYFETRQKLIEHLVSDHRVLKKMDII